MLKYINSFKIVMLSIFYLKSCSSLLINAYKQINRVRKRRRIIINIVILQHIRHENQVKMSFWSPVLFDYKKVGFKQSENHFDVDFFLVNMTKIKFISPSKYLCSPKIQQARQCLKSY